MSQIETETWYYGVADKLTVIADNQTKVYDAGKKAEKDEFWGSYLNNGSKTDYAYAFYGWGGGAFYPTYSITPNNADSMFENFNKGAGKSDYVDIAARMTECGINMDFASCLSLKYTFKNACISKIPTVDCTGAKLLNNTFYGCKAETLKLKVNTDCKYTNAFAKYSSLKNLEVEGEIGQAVSFADCTQLSKESITSIINALSGTASGLEIELSEESIDFAFDNGVDDAEWTSLIAQKTNWEITLV